MVTTRILIKETPEKIGEKVKVSGWAHNVRDHGSLIFIDLRDWTGRLQLVVDEKNKKVFDDAKKVGLEFAISVEGIIVERTKEVQNDKILTGKIELKVDELEILNECKVLPFPLSDDGRDIDEALRLKYRFIDIRRKRIRDLIEKRSHMLQFIVNWFTENDFIQVQTPILTVSSPEGARDFIVPSRLYPGKFYALPQAPQQYKQLLMVGGLHRYFQIAPCFRDEDPRADRHYGYFFQIDTEFSFPTQQEIFETVEPFFKDVIKEVTDKSMTQYPFPQIPYNESWDMYGTDKPDIRFEMKLVELTKQFNNSEMSVFKEIKCVKGIGVDKAFSRKEVDELTEKVKLQGGKGLAVFSIKDGVLEGSLVKFFNENLQKEIIEEVKKAGYEVKGEQTLFIIAGETRPTQKQMGWLRSYMGDLMQLKDPNKIAFAWIVDFDMFEWSETENRWDFMHNPFSMPKGGLEALKTQKPDEIKAQQYDLSCNGYEILSGSIRNHHPETFIEAFKICGYSEEETRSKFEHMISAFEYGAPPHGGFAIGMDRFSMVLFDEENIRDIYAFPIASGQEIMTGSPREIPKKNLDELGIQLLDKGNEIFGKITARLDKLGIKYKVLEHEEVRTSEEAAKVRGTQLSDGAKALVLKSTEYETKYIMAVIPADKQLDLKKTERAIGEKFVVAPTEEVEQLTGLKVGAIPPFGRLLGMEVYFDKSMFEKVNSAFNVGSRTRSLIIPTKDLIKGAEPNKISKSIEIVQ